MSEHAAMDVVPSSSSATTSNTPKSKKGLSSKGKGSQHSRAIGKRSALRPKQWKSKKSSSAANKDIVKVMVPPNRRKKLQEQWIRIADVITQELGLFIRGGKYRVELREPKAVASSSSGEASAQPPVPLTGRIDRPMQRAVEFLDAFMKGFEVDDAIVLLRLDSFFVSTFTMEEVKQTLKDSSTEIEALREENHCLRLRLKVITADLTSAQDEIEYLENAIKQQETLASANEELRKCNKHVRALKEQNECLLETIDKLTTEKQFFLSKLQFAEKRVALLEEDVTYYISHNKECLKDQAEEFERKIREARERVTEMTMVLEFAQKCTLEERQEKDMLQRKLSESKEEFRSLKKLYKDTCRQLDDALEDVALLQGERNCATGAQFVTKGNSLFKEVDDRRVEAEKQLNDVREKMQCLKEKLKVTDDSAKEQLKRICEKYERELTRGQRAADESRALVDKLLRENQQLEARIRQEQDRHLRDAPITSANRDIVQMYQLQNAKLQEEVKLKNEEIREMRLKMLSKVSNAMAKPAEQAKPAAPASAVSVSEKENLPPAASNSDCAQM